MPIRSIKQVKNLKGKRVLVRVDLNVPVAKGKVLEDTKLRASLPTIRFLMDKGTRVILVTHLGRPEGKRVAGLSVKPVARYLGALLSCDIGVLPRWSGMAVVKAIEVLPPGGVVMLENIRFSPEEKNEQGTFAQELAGLADIFVYDAFGVAHHPSASVSGIARFIPAYAGILLEQEIKGLSRVLQHTKTPFVAIIGGAKTETKIPVIKNLLPKADTLLLGGGMANTYYKASRYRVGDSLVDVAFEKEALVYGKKKKVVVPVDVVVGSADGKHYRLVEVKKKPHEICKKGEAILDIGPRTIALYATYIKKARTVVWNGAMGYVEQKPYAIGTLSIARLVAARSKGKAFGVIGGGETLQAMKLVGMTDDIDLVSTGGGAMLEYLAGKELPGIAALTNT